MPEFGGDSTSFIKNFNKSLVMFIFKIKNTYTYKIINNLEMLIDTNTWNTTDYINEIINYFLLILAFSSKLGYEEHIPGQTRDWNEELQTTRELPRKNLPERLLRERAIFKVDSVSHTYTLMLYKIV